MRRSVLEVVNTSLLSGGAEHLRLLAGPLVSDGWSVTIACTEDGPMAERWRALGAEVVPIDMMRRRANLNAVGQLGRLMRRLRPGIVHCHGTRAALFARLARRGWTGAPLVYTVHGFSFRKKLSAAGRVTYGAVERFLCRGADHVIFVAESDARDAAERRLLGRTPFSIIPNGVDAARFAPNGGERPARPPTVVTVARLVEQKGICHLIDAAAIVCAKVPGCRFAIAGDGPLLPKIRAQARELGLEDDCIFMGAVDRPEEALAAADLFVLPSLWEGLPIALLEAMAAGLPVVATDTPGSCEIVEGTGGGVIVPRRNAAALAEAIIALLLDRPAGREMGAAARRAVMVKYPLDVMIQRNLELYRRLAAG